MSEETMVGFVTIMGIIWLTLYVCEIADKWLRKQAKHRDVDK